MSRTSTYESWCKLIRRCYNKKDAKYPSYGARGIRVCARWRQSFEAFLEDMGEKPSREYSIDRIDNDGDYEPCNCRWATARQQSRNQRSNRCITVGGVSKTIVEWAEESGLKYNTLRNRLVAGWTPHEAVTTPVRGKRS